MARSSEKRSEKILDELIANFMETTHFKRATAGFGVGAVVQLTLDGRETIQFQKTRDGIRVLKGAPEQAELVFYTTTLHLKRLLADALLPSTTLPKLGIRILESIYSSREDEKIRVAVRSGVLNLWARGYFSLLRLGGMEISKYLAGKGFYNVSKIKQALTNMRS
jgi:hypothetical protein